jgi:hypothetical protein
VHSPINRHSLEASVLGQCMHPALLGPSDTANLICRQTLAQSLWPNKGSFTYARWQKYRQLLRCFAKQIFKLKEKVFILLWYDVSPAIWFPSFWDNEVVSKVVESNTKQCCIVPQEKGYFTHTAAKTYKLTFGLNSAQKILPCNSLQRT